MTWNDILALFKATWPIWLMILAAGLLRVLLDELEYTLKRSRQEPSKRRLSSSRRSEAGWRAYKSGAEFEQQVAQLFQSLGYKVIKTPLAYDFGVDLIVEAPGQRWAVQVKRHSKRVDMAAVDQLVSGKEYYRCTHALLIHTSELTPQAAEKARGTGVLVWTWDQALRWARQQQAQRNASGRPAT